MFEWCLQDAANQIGDASVILIAHKRLLAPNSKPLLPMYEARQYKAHVGKEFDLPLVKSYRRDSVVLRDRKYA